MLQHVLTAWKSGLRGRSFHAVFFLALAMLGAAWLAAAFSARQPQAVALDVGISGIRIGLTFLVLVWIMELVGKELERRTVFFVLAYPRPRWHYLLGRYVGILALSAFALILLGLILYLVILISTWGYRYENGLQLGFPYWMTLLGIFLDVSLVAAVTMLVATVATSNILPLAVGAMFAIACRMLGPVLDYLERGADGDELLVRRFGGITETLRWLIPDLDRLDWRLWPLYDVVPSVATMIYSSTMVIAYAIIAISLGIFAFNRRQFN